MPDQTNPGRRVRKPVLARDVVLRGKAAQEARALEAVMAEHRAGHDAYVAARAAGKNRDPHRPHYTAYKRAYSRYLALRHAAYARQQQRGQA